MLTLLSTLMVFTCLTANTVFANNNQQIIDITISNIPDISKNKYSAILNNDVSVTDKIELKWATVTENEGSAPTFTDCEATASGAQLVIKYTGDLAEGLSASNYYFRINNADTKMDFFKSQTGNETARWITGWISYDKLVDTPKLYLRRINSSDSAISYSSHVECVEGETVDVDVSSVNEYGIFYGPNYADGDEYVKTDELVELSNVSITDSSNIISVDNNILTVKSLNIDETASITYEGKTISFRSDFPYFGVYKSNEQSVNNLLNSFEYNDTQKEFYIFCKKDLNISVSNLKAVKDGDTENIATFTDVTGENQNDYNLIKLVFNETPTYSVEIYDGSIPRAYIYYDEEHDTVNGYKKYIDIDNGESGVLRYGFYYYNGNNLYNVGVSDNCVSNENDEFYFDLGVGTFLNSKSDVGTADGIPSQEIYDGMVVKSFTIEDMDASLNGKVNFSGPFDTELGPRSSSTIKVDIEDGAQGYCLLVVDLEINGNQYKIAQKIYFTDSSDKTKEIDCTGLTPDQIVNKFNDIFSNYTNFKQEFGITEGTITNSSTYVIKLTGIDDNAVVSGDLLFNLAYGENYDFNWYVIDFNGLKINGSFINTGTHDVTIKNAKFDGNNQKDIAINPKVGDISIRYCEVENYEYGTKSVKKSITQTGYSGSVSYTTFKNCGIAIYSNKNDQCGTEYEGIHDNTFIKCKTAIKFEDLVPTLSSVSLKIDNNYFLNNDLDFDFTHSGSFENQDEYYAFEYNYYSNTDSISDSNYCSAKISTTSAHGGNVIVSTSPSMMFPESAVCKYGIDKNAITCMFEGIDYSINSKSNLHGAKSIIFNSRLGVPGGTTLIP